MTGDLYNLAPAWVPITILLMFVGLTVIVGLWLLVYGIRKRRVLVAIGLGALLGCGFVVTGLAWVGDAHVRAEWSGHPRVACEADTLSTAFATHVASPGAHSCVRASQERASFGGAVWLLAAGLAISIQIVDARRAAGSSSRSTNPVPTST